MFTLSSKTPILLLALMLVGFTSTEFVSAAEEKCASGQKGYPECVDKMQITVVTKSGKKVFRGSYKEAVQAAETYIGKVEGIPNSARLSGKEAVSRIGLMLKSNKPSDTLPYWEVTCTFSWPPGCTITIGGE